MSNRMRKQQAQLELAGRVAEAVTTFDRCWLPYHKNGCCYVQTPNGDGTTTSVHISSRDSYEDNELLAREIIRKRAAWHAREDLPEANT